jgi:hypothetical protein
MSLRISRPSRLSLRISTLVLGFLWVAGIAVGMSILLNYENRPARTGTSTDIWPIDSAIQRVPSSPTLVLFAHPHCPCTRASIGELALIMARLRGQLTANVIFIRPKGTEENWEQTDLWRSAASIPGVNVWSDLNGVEASRFHAQASGETMLYSADGRLLFSGGITASRGHSGDNAGRAAIVDLVATGRSKHSRTLVFGCYLQTQSSQQRKEGVSDGAVGEEAGIGKLSPGTH